MALNLLGIGGLINGVGGVIRSVIGDKAEREANAHNAYMASMDEHSREFMDHLNRTWFDVLIDGLNRLPRPALTFGTIGLFVYAMVNPVGFSVRMEGLNLVPDPLWGILFAIIAFYFGARELKYSRDLRATSSKSEVASVVHNIKQLRSLEPGLEPLAAEIDPRAFDAEMQDSSKTLSNAAILEWNRRYQSGADR